MSKIDPKELYVVVTTVSQFRQRYVVPVSELQKTNPDVDIMSEGPMGKPIEWANDSVTCENVQEFSQKWIGEQIVDTFLLDEERIINVWDRDNDYMKDWTRQQKLEFIHNWKETKDE